MYWKDPPRGSAGQIRRSDARYAGFLRATRRDLDVHRSGQVRTARIVLIQAICCGAGTTFSISSSFQRGYTGLGFKERRDLNICTSPVRRDSFLDKMFHVFRFCGWKHVWELQQYLRPSSGRNADGQICRSDASYAGLKISRRSSCN